jgi:hypothetical protein
VMAAMPALFDAFDNDRVVAGHAHHPLIPGSRPCGLFAVSPNLRDKHA